MNTQLSSPNDQSDSGRSLIQISVALFATFFLSYTTTRWLLANDLAISNETIWYMVRSSGIVAYFFLFFSTVWGLVLSTKVVKEWIPAPVTLALHNYLSWLSIGLTLFHAVLLLFSEFFDYTLINLLVPFTGPFAPFWVGLGIIGTYLMVLTTITFYLISHLGYAWFRRIHYLSYLAFVGVLLHSWVAGTDTGRLAVVYLGSGLVVLFLTFYRVLGARSERQVGLPVPVRGNSS